MPAWRLPRSRSVDSTLPAILSGLLPSALFVAVPSIPPPELPPGARDRLSSGLAASVLGSSLLARSLGGRSSPTLQAAAPLRARSESDGAVARAHQSNANNNSADERSPNRTRQSTTSAYSSSAAAPSGDRGQLAARLEPDEHHQLREVGRPPEERGSDPDTSLYDYSDAREIEQPRRRPYDQTDDENGDTFGSGDEPESQIDESETDYKHPETDGFAREQPATLTASTVSPVLRSPSSMRSSLNRPNDPDETLVKSVAGVQQSGSSQGSPEVRISTPLLSARRRAEPAPATVEVEDPSESVGRPTAELRQENKVLKDTVYRLNVELSKYQSKYRPPTVEDIQELGFPVKGPIPSWLINTKYLAPLFLAYDDRIKEKDGIIKQYEDDLVKFQGQVEAVVKENRSLKARLSTDAVDAEDNRRRRRTIGDVPSITPAEWQPLQKQARLVLQENEVLLEQLRIQDEKLKEACRVHVVEVSTLTKKLATSEASNCSLEAELRHLRVQLNALKAQNEALVSQAKTKVDGVLHQTLIADYHQRLETLRETQSSELDSLTAALQAKSAECSDLCRQLSDLQAASKRVSFELSLSEKANRKLQEGSEKLQQALQNVDSKRRSASAILSDVLKAANQTAAERDALVKLALKQKRGELKIWNKMAENEQTKEKLAEQIKMSRKELEEQLETEKEKMKESAREHSARQREYEREIKHLRCLLREKDLELGDAANDKKHLEEEIELVWQATCRNNRRSESAAATCSPATCRCSDPRGRERHASSCRYLSPDHSQG